ncbi:DUF2795 domain-containing protein [Mycobacterium simiae]|uniref:DUF2795 domain-containing protein n=1 Tax=Mycobacterium simiae TaxID=1784 RepID=UPI0033B3BA3A
MVASTTRHQLDRCLDRVRFPASRDDLLIAAVHCRCDEDTVEALHALKSVTYTNAAQVCASVNIHLDDPGS